MTTDPITKAEVAELKWLHAGITPGRWESTGMEAGSHGHRDDTCCLAVNGQIVTGDIKETDQRKRNHDAIAACMTALPRLLAALEAAEAERDDWRTDARTAAGELCPDGRHPCGDERHCTCVGPLRKELKDTKAKLAALVKAIGSNVEVRATHSRACSVRLTMSDGEPCICGVADINAAIKAAGGES